jgi:hypothetical protein
MDKDEQEKKEYRMQQDQQKNIELRLSLIEQSIQTFTTQYNLDMKALKDILDVLTKNYMPRQDIHQRFEDMQHQLDKRYEGVTDRLKEKANKDEFKELKTNIEEHVASGNIKWGGVLQSIMTTILTGAVIGGFLYFNFK